MNNQAVSLFIAIITVPVVLIAWSIATHNLRVWQVRRLARSLPVGTRERILARITEAARGSSVCTLLVPVDSSGDHAEKVRAIPPDITASYYGGSPYGEAGEQWPTGDDAGAEPAEFLIQVRLDESLPAPWPGRLIVVFLRFDATQTALVYPAPSPAKFVRRSGGSNEGFQCRLMPVLIPKAHPASFPPSPEPSPAPDSPAETRGFENEWQLQYDPTLLLESVPGLLDELRRFTRRPVDLLTHLLLTERHGYDLDVSDIVQLGGRPQWIQDDPGPTTCPNCGRPMRFLCQFGDLSGQERLGDAGVCFVFGCDTHPDHVDAIVQMC